MLLLIRKSRIGCLDRVMKSHTFYILKFNFILLIVRLSGCFQGYPTHSPLIEGSIDISKNNQGGLCFKPIFNSAVVMENPISFNLRNGQKICLNSNNPNLEQTIYTPMNKQPLVVSIGSLDDKENHFISFQKKFNYPYTPK